MLENTPSELDVNATVCGNMSYLYVSKHSFIIKHNILRYYLGCVKTLYKKRIFKNPIFAYVETHGASGYCKDKTTGRIIDGSPIVVKKMMPQIPMVICEIDRKRFSMLKHALSTFQEENKVKLYHGDCNELIDEIISYLNGLPATRIFDFWFVDPSSTKYTDPITRKNYDQLRFETLKKIMTYRSRVDLLLTFPLIPFYRIGGFTQKKLRMGGWKEAEERLTRFYGSERWKECYNKDGTKKWDCDTLIQVFISQMQPYFKQKIIHYLVKNERDVPIYYLVFGSNDQLGIEFMEKAFQKVVTLWRQKTDFPKQTLESYLRR